MARRARKEPLRKLYDRDYLSRMSTFSSWRIHVQLFFVLVIANRILPLSWMCYHFAPSVSVKYLVSRANAWTWATWIIIYAIRPYVLQRLLKHIESHIFGKPRSIRGPHPDHFSSFLQDECIRVPRANSWTWATMIIICAWSTSIMFCPYILQGKVPVLSADAIHQLHIFIFVLAVTHFVLSAITVLGIAQTRNWRHWESKIQTNDDSAPEMIKHIQEFTFIRDHFKGDRKRWRIFGWMRSFFKQFYGSVTEEDYTTMRLGFIMPLLKHNESHISGKQSVSVKYLVSRANAWTWTTWIIIYAICPYILQRLLKHIESHILLKDIESHIFGKPRMNLTERIAAFGSTSTGRGRFILDSGASSHFVGDARMLRDIIYFPCDQSQRVTLADGFCLPIVGIGTLLFNGLSECGTYTRSYSVPNVRYVLGLEMNVISIGQLDTQHGLCSSFHSKQCEIVNARGTLVGQATLQNGLYEVVHLHVPPAPQA